MQNKNVQWGCCPAPNPESDLADALDRAKQMCDEIANAGRRRRRLFSKPKQSC